MAGQLTIDTLKASSGVLATQNGMSGIAKAWVQFNGGNGNTAGVINGSFNVSSITVNSSGDCTINFTTALANSNFAIAATAEMLTASNALLCLTAVRGSATTTTCRVICTYVNGGQLAYPYGSVTVFN